MTTIYFDMDGTIADLYAVENWLPKLRALDPTPYIEAAPLLRLSVLARTLNTLQRKGYRLGVISWLSKDPNAEYAAKVTKAKQKWLKTHLASVKWDEITIVPYGTPKSEAVKTKSGTKILFDDETPNRNEWEKSGGIAYDVTNILEVLRTMAA